ncbi:hypothetical protein Trydic_g12341 [Trypoxylus dichotomus]
MPKLPSGNIRDFVGTDINSASMGVGVSPSSNSNAIRSLQFVESTGLTDIAQLCDMSGKEESLIMIPLKGKSCGEDISDTFL